MSLWNDVFLMHLSLDTEKIRFFKYCDNISLLKISVTQRLGFFCINISLKLIVYNI